MASFKNGDRVRIVERDMTLADLKSGLFYDYFRNLTGTVEQVYDDGTVCVHVELDSLPVDVRKRHMEVQDAVRRRWMEGLGAEQRERLTDAQRSVTLTYNILVGKVDLAPAGKAKPAPEKQKAAQPSPAPPAPVARPSEEDIAKAEEEYLKSVAAKAQQSEE